MSKDILLVVLCIFMVGVAIVSLRFLQKDLKKNQTKFDTNIQTFRDEAKRIKTVEDCDLLLSKIRVEHNKTDTIYKDLRAEYRKLFHFVEGIRYAIINSLGK